MWRVHLDDRPRKTVTDDEQTEAKVLNSEFFSGPQLARRQQVLRGMRGNLHGGHR